MMDYASRFGEWQNYVHYALLAAWLFFIWNPLLINRGVIDGFGLFALTWKLFLYYIAGIFIGDSIVHAIFWFGPESIRWRD